MKTPILRLTIGKNVTLSGNFINHNEKVMPMFWKCASEQTAQMRIESMRHADCEFQLVVIRQNETIRV